jgi:hypothetical protein
VFDWYFSVKQEKPYVMLSAILLSTAVVMVCVTAVQPTAVWNKGYDWH